MPPNIVRKGIEVEFVTPAFLGNACQSGEWRVPPFKALLRQWWRIAKARVFQYDWEELRKEEGKLFGHAWPKHEYEDGGEHHEGAWAIRSSIQLRLSRWSAGALSSWPGELTLIHREVPDFCKPRYAGVQDRHILGLPVTNHDLPPLKQANARLAPGRCLLRRRVGEALVKPRSEPRLRTQGGSNADCR